jgi:hypothetical protein
MHFLKAITGTIALAACAALVPSAPAQTLQVLTAGSSAQFGPFAVAAYALAKIGGATAYHYTVKSGSSCANINSPSTTCYASLNDSARSSSIPNEPGNLWVVWSTNGIWAYLSVDSTVGVRAFSAVPRAALQIETATPLPLSATSNYPLYWADGTNDTALTSTVLSAIQGVKLTAANTDIRPEDALFATNRTLNTLGYGNVADPRAGHSGQFLIGTAGVQSTYGTGVAHPVSFAIGGGADPFTNQVGPAEVTLPIGAAPVIFLASTVSGSTVANATNITSAGAAYLFSGVSACEASLVTGATGLITPVLREPLSGTMNTTEYSVFVPYGHSQETGISASNNPLKLPCGSQTQYRVRAIGTGDSVSDADTLPSTLAYAFFSYESTASGKSDKYITLNGIDPINETYSNGALPSCVVSGGVYSCANPTANSFPNLRSGSYPAWSIYRMVTDSAGEANAATLVSKAQVLVNNSIPDFVPFTPVCTYSPTGANDPGLAIYREHFVPSTIETIPDSITITPNDGSLGKSVNCSVKRATLTPLTLGGGPEAGGDVGGKVVVNTKPPTYPGPTESQPH